MAAAGRPARQSEWGTVWQKPGKQGTKFPYYAKYTGPDGKRHSAPKVFTTRRDARAFLDKCQHAISDGSWTPQFGKYVAHNAGLTVKDLYAQYLEDRTLERSTLDNYDKQTRLRIFPTLGDVPVKTLSREQVRTWLRDLDPSKASSNAKALDLLKGLLRYAVHEGLLGSSPADGVRRPKVERQVELGDVLTAKQTMAYLRAADPEYRTVLALCALLGLRSGEARGLRREDVDLEAGTLTVRSSLEKVRGENGGWVLMLKAPKTAKARRTLPLNTHVLGALAAHINSRPMLPKAILFPTRRGGWMDPSVLERAHQRALVAIGLRDPETVRRKTPAGERIDGPRLHDMRATYATWLAENGFPIPVIMQRLGWIDSKMANEIYARVTGDQEQKMLAAEDAAFAGLEWDSR